MHGEGPGYEAIKESHCDNIQVFEWYSVKTLDFLSLYGCYNIAAEYNMHEGICCVVRTSLIGTCVAC